MAVCIVEISLDGQSFTSSRNIYVYNRQPEVQSVSSKCMSTRGGNSVIVKGRGIINTGKTSLRLLECASVNDAGSHVPSSTSSTTSSSSSSPWTEYASVIINARWDIMGALGQCADVLRKVKEDQSLWSAIERAQE